MGRNVAIGIQDFGKIRENNCFYVDKSDFIKEWWEYKDDVTLITRPRRFGKTLNMSMLEHFFSNKYEGQGEIFEGLSIWKDEKYRTLQGTYPVISLSFANVKETNYANTRKKICQIITDLYANYSFLLDSPALSAGDKEFFKRISPEMDDVDATMAIHYFSKFLYCYYGKKVIILLDEYDTPMQEAYVNGFWDDLVAFIRSMFNSSFKTNPYLEHAIMIGTLNLTKVKFAQQTSNGSAQAETMESIFSDINNLEVVTTTSDKYSTAFGFTQDEVFSAMDEMGLTDKEKVKRVRV